MKRLITFFLFFLFIFNLFYFPLKFKNVHKIENILEFSYENGLKKYKNYILKKPFFFNSISKFSIFQKDFKKIATYYLKDNEKFYEGKDFYAVKDDDLITFYNKYNSDSFEIKTQKKLYTNDSSNYIVLSNKNGLEITIYRYNEINSNIEKVISEIFNDLWNNIKFNEFSLAISFIGGTFFYYNFTYNKEYFNQFNDSKYKAGYDIAVSGNGDYFALIEGFNPQYFYILDKNGNVEFKFKKNSDYKNVFVISVNSDYFLFKNGNWIYVVNKKNEKKKFIIENKLPLKGDMITYNSNKYNIIICTEFEKHFVITVYNIKRKKYYQFSFAYPVYKIVPLDDEKNFVFYNQKKFWLVKIK